jgi:hypothetical protein
MAAREYEGNLVAQHELGASHVQMANVHGNVLRLGGAAEHVDDLETLAQLDQVAEVLQRAGAPITGRVHDVGRPRGRRECHAAIRQRDVALGVDGVQGDVARRGGQRGGYQLAPDAHDLRCLIDVGAGLSV